MLHFLKRKYVHFIRLRNYNKKLRLFRQGEKRFEIEKHANRIFLFEDTANTVFDAHYIYHPAWAARIVKQINPEYHVDISSTLHFCSILSAFYKVKFYDFRPAKLNLSDLTSEFADLNALPFESNSIHSLSCMHTIEHIGLTRYGDKLDNEGDLKAIAELKRVVAENGNLLIAVPTGKPKIIFHAHRIYSYEQVLSFFSGFTLKEFSLVTDSNDFIHNAGKADCDKQTYGCGCYWFVKNPAKG